jgi:hypothetical protein
LSDTISKDGLLTLFIVSLEILTVATLPLGHTTCTSLIWAITGVVRLIDSSIISKFFKSSLKILSQ